MSEVKKDNSEMIRRKRADTELELRWQKIQEMAEEAKQFANHHISSGGQKTLDDYKNVQVMTQQSKK
jgi:hypothetical protein